MSSSPSTTYRRLISLRDKGMITMRTDETDKRVKFVEPDSLARVYMERVRQSLNSLIESEKIT
jgi:DNA-binding MarR family transcriptional regulator